MSLELRLRELNEARVETFPILHKAAICAVVMMVASHIFKEVYIVIGTGIVLAKTIWLMGRTLKLAIDCDKLKYKAHW